MLPKTLSRQRGQILLAILVAIAIFAILTHALFTLIASSYDLVSFNKARITARHLAQEKIELIRNLPYDDVATIGGIPDGTIIPQTETVRRNGLNYNIKVDIAYVDDPFNGSGPPNDTDYKRVRVEVSWEGLASSRKNPVVLITDISAEASITLGGSLIILVVNANGNPVPQADVSIVAPSISVNLNLKTDSQGRVIRPGATPCVECYQITAIKSGMSTDRTYSTSEVANPLKPHASVFQDQITQVSFAIDTLGNLDISSRDSRENNFAPLGNVAFRLRGSKIIGTDTLAQPVYKYDETLSTDSGGNKTLANMEWDLYQILMPSPSSYDISGTSPIPPLNLSPAGSVDFAFAVNPHTDHSFFLTVKDPSQALIAPAYAKLFDGGYNETKQTGQSGDPDFGQVFFPGLQEQTYQILATASGFLDYNGSVDISASTSGEIVLSP